MDEEEQNLIINLVDEIKDIIYLGDSDCGFGYGPPIYGFDNIPEQTQKIKTLLDAYCQKQQDIFERKFLTFL